MRIGIVRKKYTYHGGSENYINSLINFLLAKGYEVSIYTAKWSFKKEGINFKKIPMLRFSSFLRDLTFAISSYLILKKDRKNLDIIQSHDKTLLQDIYRAGDGCHIQWLKERWKRAGFFTKIKIILNPYHWLILGLERLIFKTKRYKKVIAISEMVKRNIIENYQVNPDDIEVIYNSVNLERFNYLNKVESRQEIRQRFNINEKDFLVLFVGSGFERKGVRYLIEAVEKVKYSVTVLIVGKGKAEKYKKYIKNQKVIFCGPQKEIEKFYIASDIFVFPTIYEPFGLVVLEAMASGLPVITTKLSGASEIIIDGENGFTVDIPEDTEKIANYITVLIENKTLYNQIRENAIMTASNFTMAEAIKKIEHLYDLILSSKQN